MKTTKTLISGDGDHMNPSVGTFKIFSRNIETCKEKERKPNKNHTKNIYELLQLISLLPYEVVIKNDDDR